MPIKEPDHFSLETITEKKKIKKNVFTNYNFFIFFYFLMLSTLTDFFPIHFLIESI